VGVPRSSRGWLIYIYAAKGRFGIRLLGLKNFELSPRMFSFFLFNGRMAELAYAIALGAIGETLGGSNPLPPIILDKSCFKIDIQIFINQSLERV
jgi:hypothetical protein